MRVYYMDALRSVLMALGVVYHSSALYSVGQGWRLPEPAGHAAFTALSDFLHSFRMPAFFLISGYFCLLTLQKYGKGRFLRLRWQRIGVPLLATALLLNPLMNYLSWDTYRHSGFFAYVLAPAYFTEGTWIGHLWFLNNLLVYFTLAFVGAALLERPALRGLRAWPTRLVSLWQRLPARTLLLALALPLTNMAMLRVIWRFGITNDAYLGHFIMLSELCGYLPYFLAGMLLRHDQRLLDALSGWRFACAGLALAALVAVIPTEGVWYGTYIDEYLGFLIAWTLSGLCLGLFRRLCNRPSPFFLYFSDASYTIYLFHQLLVVAFGLALIEVALSPFVKFALVVTLTFLVTAAVHHYLVLRLVPLRFLFNGKTDVRGPRPAGRASPSEATG